MKILMVGLGGIGQRHARNFRTILGDSLDLLAYRVRGLNQVVTPQLELDHSKTVEQALGVRTFGDLDAALAESPEAAIICNPSSRHVPIATACARAGCDLLIEKPVSDSLDGLTELKDALAANGRIAYVAYQLRFHPCIKAARELLLSGVIGRLLSVRATVGEYMPNFHRYEDYRQGYAARADLGGGVVLTQIHEFDYLYSLFGLPKRLFALGGHWSELEIDVEDTASILMECVIDGRPLPVHLHQDYLQSPPSRQCEIIGERGKIVIDFPTLSVTAHDRPGGSQTVKSFAGFDRNQMFIEEARHFLECIADRKQPIVNLDAGIASLRMALAAKESIRTGAAVALGSEDE